MGLLSGCGGAGGNPVTPPPAASIAAAVPSGDGQVGALGAQLTQPLRVLVTRDGQPAAGEIVIWQVGVQAGSVSPGQSSTGSDGIATTRWTLGSVPAQGLVTASLGTVNGPSTLFGSIAAVFSNGPTSTIFLREAGGDRFDPAYLVVPVGTTVIWSWSDGQHDLTSTGSPSFPGDPVLHQSPREYQFTFTAAGTYNYYCVNHGTPTSGMRGSVIVQ
jgi:plastocyanin